MNNSGFYLDFERDLHELEKKIDDLKSQAETNGLNLDEGVRKLEAQAAKKRREIYANLSPWQRVQISRHPNRPYALDYVERMLSDFTELHGDRLFADDASIIGGPGPGWTTSRSWSSASRVDATSKSGKSATSACRIQKGIARPDA